MYSRTDRANGGKFPRQLVIMVTNEVADRIEAEAALLDTARGAKGTVARDYLDAGMRRKDALAKAKGGTRHPDHIEFTAPAPRPLEGPAD